MSASTTRRCGCHVTATAAVLCADHEREAASSLDVVYHPSAPGRVSGCRGGRVEDGAAVAHSCEPTPTDVVRAADVAHSMPGTVVRLGPVDVAVLPRGAGFLIGPVGKVRGVFRGRT